MNRKARLFTGSLGIFLVSLIVFTACEPTPPPPPPPAADPIVWEGFEDNVTPDWSDLTGWGGQAFTPAISTLHATEGTHTMSIPVNLTINATLNSPANQHVLGTQWISDQALYADGAGLIPNALLTRVADIASVSIDYYWAPDASDTAVPMRVSLYIQGWSNTLAANGNWGGNAALTANAAGTLEIPLNNLVNLDFCFNQFAIQVQYNDDNTVNGGAVITGTIFLDNITFLDDAGDPITE